MAIHILQDGTTIRTPATAEERSAEVLAELKARTDALSRVEHLAETNQGTYGAAEACRKVGCGDPRFADRNVYETVGGRRHETGPDAADAPGRMRPVGRAALARDRKRLAELQRQIRQEQRRAVSARGD